MAHLQNAVLLHFFALLLIIIKIQFCCGRETYSNHASCIDSERTALVKFREGLIDEANRLSSWLGEDCCTWKGVSCNNLTGHVVKLELRNPVLFDDSRYSFDVNYTTYYENNLLGGKLNPSLLRLKHLKYLDLSMNNFSKIQIPKFLGSLKNLRYLNISNAKFFGNIPNHLGNLTSLQYLDLRSINFPSNLTTKSLQWVTQLSSLKSLDLSGVQVEESKDWFDWIAMLPSLSSLNLRLCGLDLTFPHPPASLVNLTLASLDLGENYINSTIPLWLFNISSLVNLSLYGTELRGSIPSMFKNLISLASLDLSVNHLSSSLPDTLCNLTSLTRLNLHLNNIKGSIPSTIGQLTKLNLLDLSDNQLNGTIPSTIGQLTKLNYLDLSANFLSGMLSELHYGQLPSSLQNLKYLENLDLGGNQLKGTIPEWIGNELLQLKFLRLQSNNFYGDIPLEICQLSSLQVLNLAQNNLTGHIPHCFQNLSAMASNRTTFPRITYFSWTDFLLNIAKGREILYTRNLNDVKSMVLSDNRLIGEIPNELMDLVELQTLDLSNNCLSGKIPAKIGNMKHLESLNLARNQLSGAIPPSLANIDFLSYLNLSFNNLSGRIPSENQLQTLNDESIYEGNSGLCGKPLPNSCLGDKSSTEINGHVLDDDEKDENDDGLELSWFYAGIGLGFAVGLVGVFVGVVIAQCSGFGWSISWKMSITKYVISVHNKI